MSTKPGKKRPRHKPEPDDLANQASSGFGDLVSKLTAKDTRGKVPFLSKRRTTAMKLESQAKIDQAAAKAARKAKLEARSAWVHEPDAVQADFERDLRKVATQGVVTLFNAIAKHQKAAITAEEVDETITTNKAQAMKSSFVELLSKQGAASESRTGAAAGAAGAPSGAPASTSEARPAWDVLSDDYLTKSMPTMKDWGKVGEEDWAAAADAATMGLQ